MESQNLEFKLDEPTFSPNDASFLRDLNGLIPGESSAPSYIPSKFEEQFRLVGNKLYVYNPTTQAWLSFSGVSPGWQFVSHNAPAPTTSPITISGLDLDTDLNYHIIVHARNTTAGGIFTAQVNGDSTANAHHWASQGNKLTNGEDNSASDTDTSWQLNHSSGDLSMGCSMFLMYNSGSPVATWTTVGTGFSGDIAARVSTVNGAGYWNTSDNITSINFAHNSGSSIEWETWVFKSSQS